MSQRFILHVDMDAFFASVEQRDNPDLRGKPVAVGSDSARGVIAAASYEAREFGVHSALASRIAVSRCPHLIFVPHRFSVYKEVSQQIRDVFGRYTDLIEPLSLDEAYLDISHAVGSWEEAISLAQNIKRDIREETQLTATAGVAAGKFLAKLASGLQKPDGLTVITPEEARAFLDALPIGKFHGVGPATSKKFTAIGIHTGGDLAKANRIDILRRFGKRGGFFHDIANNIDVRPVRPNRVRKSISAETTFSSNYDTFEALLPRLEPLAKKVFASLQRLNRTATGVVVKVKFSDHTIQTRQAKVAGVVTDEAQLLATAQMLLTQRIELRLPVRLLGVGVTGLNEPEQAREVKEGQTGFLF